MENFYLIDYIKRHSGIDADILDSIKYELDKSIYYYGGHFRRPKEFSGNYKAALWEWLGRFYCEYRHIFKILLKKSDTNTGKRIISNAYFTVNEELEGLGYNVYTPPWSLADSKNVLNDIRFYHICKKMNGILNKSEFAGLICGTFLKRVEDFRDELKSFYTKNKISALIVPNDVAFFENLSIKVFKDMHRPSFVFLHGLPGRYNNIDENRADYLIVWGEKIKEHYIKAGLPREKILVSGHPYYKKFNNPALKSDTGNILVITKSMNGSQHGDGACLSDRGNPILYLYSIRNVLKKNGVKSVRLRVHPSENRDWYLRFIDKGFFKLDIESLSNSFKRSTLVIGPSSTVFLESIYHGVNYLIYEPADHGIDLMNFKLVPPFDGSDGRIPVAYSEDELMMLLEKNIKTEVSFFGDYIKTPFDMSFIKKYI